MQVKKRDLVQRAFWDSVNKEAAMCNMSAGMLGYESQTKIIIIFKHHLGVNRLKMMCFAKWINYIAFNNT